MLGGLGITTLACCLGVCIQIGFGSLLNFYVLSQSCSCHSVHLVELHQAAASSWQVHSQDALIFVEHFMDSDKFPCFVI